jgi:ribosomal protein S18 acetylase RimI-like enzyme
MEWTFSTESELPDRTLISIRSLTESDVDRGFPYYRTLPPADAGQRFPSRIPVDAGYLKPALDGRWRMLVAYSPAGEVIGEIVSWLDPDHRFEIFGSVAPNWRRRGVASALIDAIGQVARADRAYYLYANVAATNSAAVALFQHLGFALGTPGRRGFDTYRLTL